MLTEIQVGIITGTHGLKGELKVFPTTDEPHRFDRLKRLSVVFENGSRREMSIEKVRYFKERPIIKFCELQDIGEAEAFKKATLWIPREQALPLAAGEYFVGDLIGCKVTDEKGEVLGKIADVLKTGANDVYVCRPEDGPDILIPVIDSCVLEKKPEDGYVTVRLLPWI